MYVLQNGMYVLWVLPVDWKIQLFCIVYCHDSPVSTGWEALNHCTVKLGAPYLLRFSSLLGIRLNSSELSAFSEVNYCPFPLTFWSSVLFWKLTALCEEVDRRWSLLSSIERAGGSGKQVAYVVPILPRDWRGCFLSLVKSRSEFLQFLFIVTGWLRLIKMPTNPPVSASWPLP